MDPVSKALAMVERFNVDIIGLPIPLVPTRLSDARKNWAETALREEMLEFRDASTLEDEADALIDLAYFALGRIVEMGLAPMALFEEVHQANMRKKRGELSKRPNSLGFDAVKPADWVPPNLAPLLTVDLETILTAIAIQQHPEMLAIGSLEEISFGKFKVIILGHARHGKDTAAELLAKLYGLGHVSSSIFCAENVVLPAMQKANQEWLTASQDNTFLKSAGMPFPNYATAKECYEDRGRFRAEWFNFIANFNKPDGTALGRAIFEEFDIYVGLRNAREFHALKNAGVPTLTIWVDRSEHVGPEDPSSCSVEPWMADFVVDNNGTPEDLERNLREVFDRFLGAPEASA